MDTPGSALREEREKQKKSLNDVAKKLKIKGEYLHAIEDDDYSLLPAEVFTKAYLRLYSESLGLETEHILNLYTTRMEEAGIRQPRQSVGERIPASLKKTIPRTFPWKPVLITGATVFILVYALLLRKPGEQKSVEIPREKTETVTRSPENPPGITKKAELSPAEITPVPKATAAKTPEKIIPEHVMEELNAPRQTTGRHKTVGGIIPGKITPDKLNLKISALELTWVSVSIDNGVPKESILRTGESLTVAAAERLAIKIGNAGGTRLIFNDKDMGDLGPHGKVVDIVLPHEKKIN